MRRLHGFIIIAVSALFWSCIENPFGGGDEISGGARTLRGQVALSDNAKAEGVYVWLEGFNLGTKVNAQNEFTLTLPAAGSQSSGGGASGVYKIYFYLANYKLAMSSVALRNGAFVYGQGEVNKNGELLSTKSLERFLRVRTQVSPAAVAANYTGTISVEVTLEATLDTATVVFPNTLAGLLGAVLLRRSASNEVYIVQAVPGASGNEVQRIGRSPVTRALTFSLISSPLPPGTYEVAPYIWIRHQAVPALLAASLGGNVEEMSASYFNLPMQREGGQFQIAP